MKGMLSGGAPDFIWRPMPGSILESTGTRRRGIAQAPIGATGGSNLAVWSGRGGSNLLALRNGKAGFAEGPCFAKKLGARKAFSNARARLGFSWGEPLCVCSCPNATAEASANRSRQPFIWRYCSPNWGGALGVRYSIVRITVGCAT